MYVDATNISIFKEYIHKHSIRKRIVKHFLLANLLITPIPFGMIRMIPIHRSEESEEREEREQERECM